MRNDITDFGKFADIMRISLLMLISYTNKFSSLNASVSLFTEHTQTEQNQNGI